MRIPAPLIHVPLWCFFSAVTYYWLFNVNEKASEDEIVKRFRKYDTRYLTMWTFTSQWIYLTLRVGGHLLNAFGANRLKSKVVSTADYIFMSVATPMALVVSSVFWPLYLYDRNLVLPKTLDPVIPPWLNQALHTGNSVAALIDLVGTIHNLPNFVPSLGGLCLYLVAYSTCFFATYFQLGVWMYPVFKVLSWPMRFLLSASVLVLSVASLFITRNILKKMLYTNSSDKSGVSVILTTEPPRVRPSAPPISS